MISPSAQVRLLLRLTPLAGMEAALADAVKAIVLDVIQEPGCLSYVVHLSQPACEVVVIYQGWTDRPALEAHLEGRNFAGLSARFPALLAAPPATEWLQRIA